MTGEKANFSDLKKPQSASLCAQSTKAAFSMPASSFLCSFAVNAQGKLKHSLPFSLPLIEIYCLIPPHNNNRKHRVKTKTKQTK
jgi:hypothetical protein